MFIAVFMVVGILGAIIIGAILGMGDANRATQHWRDREIIDELKNISDKLDKE